jgi:hypothetical protein
MTTAQDKAAAEIYNAGVDAALRMISGTAGKIEESKITAGENLIARKSVVGALRALAEHGEALKIKIDETEK